MLSPHFFAPHLKRFLAREHEKASLRQLLIRRLVPRMVGLAAFSVMVLVGGSQLSDADVEPLPATPFSVEEEELLPAEVTEHLRTHPCWKGDRKYGPPAKSVIYRSKATADKLVIGGLEETLTALEQRAGKRSAGYDIYAFCQ